MFPTQFDDLGAIMAHHGYVALAGHNGVVYPHPHNFFDYTAQVRHLPPSDGGRLICAAGRRRRSSGAEDQGQDAQSHVLIDARQLNGFDLDFGFLSHLTAEAIKHRFVGFQHSARWLPCAVVPALHQEDASTSVVDYRCGNTYRVLFRRCDHASVPFPLGPLTGEDREARDRRAHSKRGVVNESTPRKVSIQYAHRHEGEEMATRLLFKRDDGKWAWHLEVNGRVVATDGGQGYENEGDADLWQIA